jgi:hypothetical protein
MGPAQGVLPRIVYSGGMRPVARAGLVAGGYVAAFAIAWLVVRMYIAATNVPDRQVYGAMYDFGDSLLFLGTLGLAAVPATGAALFFLRGSPAFWKVLSITALAIACTSVAAFLIYLAPMMHSPKPVANSWSAFASLRILVAPLFALFFLLSWLFAPNRSARIALLAAGLIETAVFGYYLASTWFHSAHV